MGSSSESRDGHDGDDNDNENKNKKKKKVSVSSLVKAPSSVGDLLSRVFSLVTSFFTSNYISYFMNDDPDITIFFIFFGLMVIVFMWYDTVKTIIKYIGENDDRWNGTITSLIDFITMTLILIVFQYAPKIVFQYLAMIGLSFAEKTILLLIGLLILFAGYEYMTDIGSKSFNDHIDDNEEINEASLLRESHDSQHVTFVSPFQSHSRQRHQDTSLVGDIGRELEYATYSIIKPTKNLLRKLMGYRKHHHHHSFHNNHHVEDRKPFYYYDSGPRETVMIDGLVYYSDDESDYSGYDHSYDDNHYENRAYII